MSVSLEEDVSPRAFRYQSLFQSPRVCPACSRSQSQERKRGNSGRAIDMHLLCALTGSAYQVAWATDIRAEHMKKFLSLIDGRDGDGQGLMIAEMVRLVNQQPHARFWIEHQANTFAPFISVCNALIRSIVIDVAFVPKLNSDAQLDGAGHQESVG